MKPIILLLLNVFFSAPAEDIIVNSPVFEKGYIPLRYTCEGENINPPLVIENYPVETKSLVLIMDDPDATNGTFDHWIAWNITPGAAIVEGESVGVEGSNGKGSNGYVGPCPPSGVHHYYFKVYALDRILDLKPGANKKTVENAMQGHIIAKGELIGLYEKQNK